ncbi:hypothetical protein ZEAMMB73_Zm00001d009129 [Zea mays]|uniref:Uncharacterized protein n=1 Tax=Zea mays TaxID=4577 RepID=A0A1D6FHU0_MAIZE|nr:hypothetical protein ZEAMMB73_Zm00001d009129 [Zea mays]
MGEGAMGNKEELPAQPKQRREGSGVWEKGEGGLPFIEPSSGHVRLHQQMAALEVIRALVREIKTHENWFVSGLENSGNS